MHALSPTLIDDVTTVLTNAGRVDLVERLQEELSGSDVLTSQQAAEILGVASPNTVKKWLKGGQFPGAYQTPGGHWRFLRTDVLAVRERMQELRAMNSAGDLEVDDAECGAEPPML